MSIVSAYSEFARFNKQRAEARDEKRGYMLSKGRLILAYIIELFVIAASLYGAWLFANQYGHNDQTAIHMMMLAPIGYAIIEFCRVPLAYSTRTQTSILLRTVAIVGVIASAGVTVKSMSQLGEIMFRPRLMDVAQARQDLSSANSRLELVVKQIDDADDAVGSSKAAMEGAQKAVADASADLGKLPPNKCSVVTSRNSNGRSFQRQVCNTDPRVAVMNGNLKGASEALAAARTKYEEDRKYRVSLDRQPAEDAATKAKVKYDEAITHSQLHSFTAMAFGKDPQKVGDGEVAEFLRIFVFVPAFLVAFAASSLAITSVHKLPKRREPVMVPDEAAAYILGPYVQTIIEATTKNVRAEQERVVEEAVAKAKASPPPPEPPAEPVVDTRVEVVETPENVVRITPKRDA